MRVDGGGYSAMEFIAGIGSKFSFFFACSSAFFCSATTPS